MYFYRAKNQTEIKENMFKLREMLTSALRALVSITLKLILETNMLIRRLIKMDFIRSSIGTARRKEKASSSSHSDFGF